MEDVSLLQDIVILVAVSVPISILLTRLGLPTIVGFFLTGIIIGPGGFALITETETVETLAQIGVVLLLFTIGLEFSVTRMLSIRKEAMLGGGLQILFTVFLVWVFETLMGQSFQVALLLGFVVSLSSSAIVLKLLTDSIEVNSSHGKLSVGILLFQDISMVLMVLVIQGFGEGTGVSAVVIAREIGIAIVAMFIIVVTVAYIVPRLFYEVVKLKNREVFILTIVLVCLGTAWITSSLGLSLAVGAFIAGLAISESEYSNQIVAEVLPFRDTFSSLFFISMGMLLNVVYLYNHIWELLGVVAAVIALKALVVVGVGQILRYPLRLSVIVGLNLAQIGEFSFILILMGEEYGIIHEDMYQMLLAMSLITMAITPFVFQYSPRIAAVIGRSLGMRFAGAKFKPKTQMENHVVIVGYGLNGRNLAHVLSETAIEHLVMDINFDRVRKAKKSGHSAYFGDSSHPEVLKMMGVDKAKMLVLAITDPVSTRRTVKNARELNPGLNIIVRTRYINELDELYKLGATQVIPEEFETSVEIFSRVLKAYSVPGNIIQNQIDLVRQEGYVMFRNPSLGQDRLANLASILETSVMDTFYIDEGCGLAGMTLEKLNLRRRTGGATIMAVLRGGHAETNPRGDFVMEVGDVLVILGSHSDLNTVMKILKEVCPKDVDGGNGDSGGGCEAEKLIKNNENDEGKGKEDCGCD